MTFKYNDYKILPSILAADFGKILEEVSTVDLPEIDHLHIDVMDGNFVPNLTFGPGIVKSLKKHTRFKLDVHLMIMNAVEMIPVFVDAGADIITIHQEAVTHLHRSISDIKKYGIKAGITLNPATSLENIRLILNEVDLVLILTVNPGHGGQKFIPWSIDKITHLNRMRKEYKADYVIEVDGGINPNIIGKVYEAGARYFVSGSSIFQKTDRKKAIEYLINGIEQTRLKKSTISV